MKESYPKICHKYVLSSSLRDLNCFRPIRVRIKRPKTKLRIRFFSETGTRTLTLIDEVKYFEVIISRRIKN
jgi:hypothetical protein